MRPILSECPLTGRSMNPFVNAAELSGNRRCSRLADTERRFRPPRPSSDPQTALPIDPKQIEAILGPLLQNSQGAGSLGEILSKNW